MIPSQISELAHFVAIPENAERVLASTANTGPAGVNDNLRFLRRSTTTPARDFSSGVRPSFMGRTRSIADPTVGSAREELRLFLAGNRIREIPPQLFLLDRLTVLSLRK